MEPPNTDSRSMATGLRKFIQRTIQVSSNSRQAMKQALRLINVFARLLFGVFLAHVN